MLARLGCDVVLLRIGGFDNTISHPKIITKIPGVGRRQPQQQTSKYFTNPPDIDGSDQMYAYSPSTPSHAQVPNDDVLGLKSWRF